MTTASEQFGTNIRVTMTAPNFVRSAVVPLTFAFQGCKGTLGVAGSAAIAVDVVKIALSLCALHRLDETYGKDLNVLEH